MENNVLWLFIRLTWFENWHNSATLAELELTKSGRCGIQSLWFVQKCKEAGYNATMMCIPSIPSPTIPYGVGGGHTVAAVKLNDTWAMFDCSNGTVFLRNDESGLLSWPDLVNHIDTYKEMPRLLQLDKKIYSVPSENPYLCNLRTCHVCNSSGIIEQYYNVDNIAQATTYLFQDPVAGWVVKDSRTDQSIRKLFRFETRGDYVLQYDGYDGYDGYFAGHIDGYIISYLEPYFRSYQP